MKRVVFINLVVSSLLFGANTNGACPDLSKKSINIDESRQIGTDLRNFTALGADVYFDLLKKYNKTQDIDAYIVKETLAEVGDTLIYGDLLGIRYRIDDLVNVTHKYKADSEEIKKLEEEYLRVVNLIDSKNNNWCNNGASDEVKEFVIKELRAKLKNVGNEWSTTSP